MKSYVYEILHKPTGSVYVGSRVASELETIQKYSGSSTSDLFSDESIANNPDDYQKTIFKTFDTVKGAYKYENGNNGMIKRWMDEYGPLCANKCYYDNNKQVFGMHGKNHSDESKAKISESVRNLDFSQRNFSYLKGNNHNCNRMRINKVIEGTKKVKSVLKHELDEYLNSGWVLGEGQRPTTSKALKGNKNAAGNTNNRGKVYVHKKVSGDCMRKMIRASELDNYLSDGWCLGMGNY